MSQGFGPTLVAPSPKDRIRPRNLEKFATYRLGLVLPTTRLMRAMTSVGRSSTSIYVYAYIKHSYHNSLTCIFEIAEPSGLLRCMVTSIREGHERLWYRSKTASRTIIYGRLKEIVRMQACLMIFV